MKIGIVHTLRTSYAKDEGSSSILWPSNPFARIFTVIEKFATPPFGIQNQKGPYQQKISKSEYTGEDLAALVTFIFARFRPFGIDMEFVEQNFDFEWSETHNKGETGSA